MHTLFGFFDEMGELLSGYAQNRQFPDIELSLPAVLLEDARMALIDAAAQDVHCPDGDPFAPFGKWHRAANIVQARLYEQCWYERGYALLLGDWSHRALMHAARKELGELG